ncbi:hypothetical protein MYX76_14695 [Desulfobacterota bacterium AH_259_B03_O07]|nr:hypothetical protein [Desulfobacterota bacterium AH_259_B03_O07]
MTNIEKNKFQDIYNDNFRSLNIFFNANYDIIGKYQSLWFNLLKPLKTTKPLLKRCLEEQYLEGIQRKGARFLSELYDLSEFNHTRGFNMYDIGKRIGFDRSDTDEIVNNLSRAEMIRRDKSSDEVFITPYGIMINNRDITVGYAPIL